VLSHIVRADNVASREIRKAEKKPEEKTDRIAAQVWRVLKKP
jgi:hypothetical protein